MEIIELTGTADDSGDLTLDATQTAQGNIEKIIFDWSDGDAIADIVITEQGPISQAVITVANLGVVDLTWYPRVIANKVSDGTSFTAEVDRLFITGRMRAVVSGSTVAIGAIDGTATTITVDTSADHNLSAGDTVTIAGTTNYNGTFVVATITDADTFTIASIVHDEAPEATGTMIRGGATYRLLIYVDKK